jgi:putative glutamine amidotransferase
VLLTTAHAWQERPLRREVTLTGRDYVDALVRVGLLPSLAPSLPEDAAAEALAEVDALVLTGGVDVDPARYGQSPHRDLGEVDARRDAFELALYREARGRDMPVLGICRGIQLIAVAEGGTLHQHLPALPKWHQHEQRARDGDPAHRVRLTPGSRIRAAFGTETAWVNSYHHQGIDRPPDGLTPTAHADDGLVEALEDPAGPFLLAVQWHPELSFARHEEQLAPFAALAAALEA